jgi:hypothetical protein
MNPKSINFSRPLIDGSWPRTYAQAKRPKKNSSSSKGTQNVIKVESRFGGGRITQGQALAELMCERMAKIQKVELEYRFWESPLWLKAFKDQLYAANSLLKKYSYEAITKALLKQKTTYSYRSPFFEIAVEKEERNIKKAPTTPTAESTPITNEEVGAFVPVVKKSKLSRLDD